MLRGGFFPLKYEPYLIANKTAFPGREIDDVKTRGNNCLLVFEKELWARKLVKVLLLGGNIETST